MHMQVQAETFCGGVAEGDHLAKLPRGVDMKHGEGRFGGKEGLRRKVQQDRTVFANGIHHDGAFESRRDLAQDMDALSL